MRSRSHGFKLFRMDLPSATAPAVHEAFWGTHWICRIDVMRNITASATLDYDNPKGLPMRPLATLTLALSITLSAGAALADESPFLASLKGSWSGNGTVTTRIGATPTNVSCSFDSAASGASLAMNGSCRGFVVIQRAISANLKADGASYSGTYLGPSGRPSSLSGSRQGDAINLDVRWSREINGDRMANMTIQKVGSNGLRLRTTDKDPKTGQTVVTSDINLTR